jgi:histidyl-tRNA synthetase
MSGETRQLVNSIFEVQGDGAHVAEALSTLKDHIDSDAAKAATAHLNRARSIDNCEHFVERLGEAITEIQGMAEDNDVDGNPRGAVSTMAELRDFLKDLGVKFRDDLV